MNTIDVSEFEDDERYDKRCGELFLTSKGNMTFHCTLCEDVYKNFRTYLDHLYQEHLKEQDCMENITDSEVISTADDSFDAETDDIADSFDLIESFEQNISEQKLDAEIRSVNKRTLSVTETESSEERCHKCPICGMGFKTKFNMRYHARRHSTYKSHKCPECDMKFYTPTEVKLHLTVHTRERKHLCTECGTSFRTKFELKIHIKRHKNERDYKCNICEKAFFTSKILRSHMISHSEERPYQCQMCPATFARSASLVNHVKIHENKREYKCELCGKAFNQRPGLCGHMKQAHKDT